MKKYLLIFFALTFITTGCGNTNKNEPAFEEIENIAINIAIANVNNNIKLMQEYITKLNETGATFTKTYKTTKLNDYNYHIYQDYNLDTKDKTSCALVYYKYRNKEKVSGYCK